MLVDPKSEAVFRVVAEDPTRCIPLSVRFMELLTPFFGECYQDSVTGEWKVIPASTGRTHVKYTTSGSTSFHLVSGYEDYDHDDEEHWE